MASTPATRARPNATNHGSSPATAKRVAGREKLKPSTPSAPSVTPAGTITLLLALMNEDNAAVRVIEDLRAAAHAGRAGDRMPSVRDLMTKHRASPATVQQAIQKVAAEGLVEVRPGRGSYVAQRTRATNQDLSWQAVALGEGRPGEDLVANLLAVPKPEVIPLSSG